MRSIHENNNILVRDLCKQFDGFLLDHVSFQVPSFMSLSGECLLQHLLLFRYCGLESVCR